MKIYEQCVRNCKEFSLNRNADLLRRLNKAVYKIEGELLEASKVGKRSYRNCYHKDDGQNPITPDLYDHIADHFSRQGFTVGCTMLDPYENSIHICWY